MVSAETFNAPARILAVDDEKVLHDYYRRMLLRYGYQVQAAESAEEALCLLEREEFDLILLDLEMPGMGGMEFLRVLRRKKKGPEVLMVSGVATLSDAVEAGKLGVVDAIKKPFDPLELQAKIRRMLEKHNNPVAAYIRAHFAEIKSRKQVAQHFHCHPTTVSNQIKHGTNQTFQTFLESCRIQEAQRLLVTTDLSVKEIAACVGFGSGSTFERAFQRQVGHLPRQYRREMGG